MENTTEIHQTTAGAGPAARASNDNRHKGAAATRSAFPRNAVARVYRPSRSVTTSGRARTRCWRLTFERRTAPVIEPLMGYTSGDDTLTQVELSFPTLESAVRYAERQGLAYVVRRPAAEGEDPPVARGNGGGARHERSTRAFSDATLDRLGLIGLQENYGRALAGATRRNDPSGPQGWATPMGVVHDPDLALEAKRAILMNWAWSEYLLDQATGEGMPENGRRSRLDEVEQALLALEGGAAVEPVAGETLRAA
jgi:hypothetical protein